MPNSTIKINFHDWVRCTLIFKQSFEIGIFFFQSLYVDGVNAAKPRHRLDHDVVGPLDIDLLDDSHLIFGLIEYLPCLSPSFQATAPLHSHWAALWSLPVKCRHCLRAKFKWEDMSATKVHLPPPLAGTCLPSVLLDSMWCPKSIKLDMCVAKYLRFVRFSPQREASQLVVVPCAFAIRAKF